MAELYRLLRPLLFALPPESAHALALAAMRRLGGVRGGRGTVEASQTRLFGVDFPNPVGLAAGFDKDAHAIAGARALGFGFVEVGTVTPRPQPGNPRPRLFRLTRDRALINRMGFNNAGFDIVHARVEAAKAAGAGPVGVNIGANRDSEDRIADYAAGVRRFADLADYLAINISSPNTPGLRRFQSRDALTRLLEAVSDARAGAGRRLPILLKIAPDLDRRERNGIAEAVRSWGIDGLIISNTTIARPPALRSRRRREAGGLSGAPLFDPSTALLAEMGRLTDGAVALIGVGGIMSAADARAKRAAGASLVQLYTGLVYEGPSLVRDVVRALRETGEAEGPAKTDRTGTSAG